MTQVTLGGCRVRHVARPRGLVAPGRRGWGPGLVAAVLLGLIWAGTGSGAPGALDPSFGAGGVAVTFGPQDFANALVLQPDAKLVVAGRSSPARVSWARSSWRATDPMARSILRLATGEGHHDARH